MKTILIILGIIAAILMAQSSNAQFFKKMTDKLNGKENKPGKSAEAPQKQYEDQGMTSPTHENYVGQIVFADNKDAIAFKNEKPADFKNQLTASNQIHSRIYLDQSLGNIQINGNEMMGGIALSYDIYINGTKVAYKRSFDIKKINIPEHKQSCYTDYVKESKQIQEWTTWRLPLLPDPKDPEVKYGNVNMGARAFVLALLEQKAGTHQIKIELSAYSTYSNIYTDVLARGEFSLVLSKEDKERLASAYAAPLPKDEWEGNNKAALLEEVRKAFQDKIKISPLKVGLLGKDWTEHVYTDTKGKYRTVSAWAVFPDVNGNGMSPLVSYNWTSNLSTDGWTKLFYDGFCTNCPDWEVEIEMVKALQTVKH